MANLALIPDKLYYRISEVGDLLSLKPSVLRYWESEFSSLQPLKSSSGQRLYSKKDIELLAEIKRLLYSEKLTIAGTKKRLQESGKEVEEERLKLLREIKAGLLSLRNELAR